MDAARLERLAGAAARRWRADRDHDDLLQEARIAVWQADDVSDALATTIARRRCIDWLRRRDGRRNSVVVLDPDAGADVSAVDPEPVAVVAADVAADAPAAACRIGHEIRFPVSPLLAATREPTFTRLARRCGVDRRTVFAWRRDGLTMKAAVAAAGAAGFDPADVWSDWHAVDRQLRAQVATVAAIIAEGGTRRAAAEAIDRSPAVVSRVLVDLRVVVA